MKKTSMRLLIVVSLMALVACSWYMLLDNTKKDQQQYADLLGKARTAVSEKLYMDALDYYKETMEYRDSIELRDERFGAVLGDGSVLVECVGIIHRDIITLSRLLSVTDIVISVLVVSAVYLCFY